jgi:hypothetical protein
MSDQDSSIKSSTTNTQVINPKNLDEYGIKIKIDPMEWAEIYGHENFRENKNSSIK